jgi:DNA-binding Xre family transcriptional regulator
MPTTQSYPRIMLRTREIATIRGILTPNELGKESKMEWRTAREYLDDTVLRMHLGVLGRICGALSCTIDDIVYIYDGEPAPPRLHLGVRHPEMGQAEITTHVADRAKSLGIKTSRDLAELTGLQRGPVSLIWLGDWERVDRKSTLPRIYKALQCTRISDLITIRHHHHELGDRRSEIEAHNMAAA